MITGQIVQELPKYEQICRPETYGDFNNLQCRFVRHQAESWRLELELKISVIVD